MNYDAYFHNDFDGRASTAVMLAFLRSRGDDIEHYIPLKYDIIPKWLDDKFLEKNKLFKGKHNPAIVVDFPYHPQAAFWFDHHIRPFRKPSWERVFKSDKSHRYNDQYRSACHLVFDSLVHDFGWKPPAHIKELVKWLNIIDFANYKSPRQTIEMKEPAIQINNFIEENSKDLRITIATIDALSRQSLAAFVRTPKVAKSVLAMRRDTKKALEFYHKKMVIRGKVMVVDLTGFPYKELAHYAPYYLDPKLPYAIRFHPFPGKPTLFHINVGANPWRRGDNKRNIGELMKTYGGGGHKDVGGVEISGRKSASKAVDEMLDFLNAN